MDMGTQHTQNSFSDEEITARLAAETRKLTITPLSDAIKVDSASDAQIIAQHTSGPALANTSTDTEETRPEMLSYSDRRTGGHILALTLTSAVLVIAGTALYLLVAPR